MQSTMKLHPAKQTRYTWRKLVPVTALMMLDAFWLHLFRTRACQAALGWLPIRFSLSPEQVTYLNAVDSGLLSVWSTELAYAIIHRVSVILDKPAESNPISLRGTKLILSEAEREWLEGQTKQGKNTGQLTFTITY